MLALWNITVHLNHGVWWRRRKRFCNVNGPDNLIHQVQEALRDTDGVGYFNVEGTIFRLSCISHIEMEKLNE